MPLRFMSAALIVSLYATNAFSQTWSGSEGVCNDWRTQWRMVKQADGGYSGGVTLDQVRASCTPGGAALSGNATASISGARFTANRVTLQDNNTCNFTGSVSGADVNGTYTCSNGGPYNFSLRIQ